MTEKIEWYKEVLELEPNSKVFFPLARMLANEGETEEAIDIIEKGLVRHPEFLEARLYCIELLHKCGRIDACQPHVERLSKMLSAYGEFWRAWASCIAAMKESGSEDTASALRFLAANFLHGPISLSKIIEEGLTAVLGENRQDASLAASLNLNGNSAALLQTAAPANEAEPAAPQETAPVAAAAAVATGAALGGAAAEEAFPDIEEAAQPAAPAADDLLDLDMTAATPADDAFPAVEEAAQPAAPAADDLLDLDLTTAAPAAKEEATTEINEADALLTDEALFAEAAAPAGAHDDDMFADMDEEAALADLDATLAAEGMPETEAPLLADTDSDTAVDLAADLALDIPAESDPAEEAPQQETFSIRTRSMAEVLAEQGDLQGALEIYQELAQAADGPEKDELSQRIVTLQARLGGAVPTPAVEEAPAKAPTGKEQVLSVLTSLAKGLESRAH